MHFTFSCVYTVPRRGSDPIAAPLYVSLFLCRCTAINIKYKLETVINNKMLTLKFQAPAWAPEKIKSCGVPVQGRKKDQIPRAFSLSCFYCINHWNAQNLYIHTHVCSHSGRNAGAETQMHPLKHILLFLIAGGFKINRSGVPEATVSHSLSIIRPKTQQLRQSQTAPPPPIWAGPTPVRLCAPLLNYCFLLIFEAKLQLKDNKWSSQTFLLESKMVALRMCFHALPSAPAVVW